VPYKDKDKQRAYQKQRVAKIREQWFKENGPCKECGSRLNLEIHHKDPTQKESHRIWSWAKERREAELKKCEVLCTTCHMAKHNKQWSEHGMASMYRKGCRCEACIKAKAIERKTTKINRKS